ncbi:MAG: ATP-binding protein [Deinococcota bacterium]|nr:AAA family ATPase [Allomeiothermus silvanus]MCL6567815.1 MoxR family ATPase [Allomeiothermus silvanus]
MEQQAFAIAVAAQVPTHLIGMPGIGKTALVRSIARKLGWHLEVMIAANRDRTDFGGIPLVKDGRLELAHLPWVERLLAARQAILFIDEIGGTPLDVRPSLLKVIDERVVGDTPLPRETVVVAASNPGEWGEGDGAEVWSLAMKTRMVHIPISPPSAAHFTRALVQGWEDPLAGLELPTPQAVATHLPRAKALIASFLMRQPQAVAPIPKPGDTVWGWPNPRTWESIAARGLAAWLAMGSPETMREALQIFLLGALGPYGLTFAAWLQEQEIPDPEALLADPEMALPLRQDQLYTLMYGVVAAVLSTLTHQRWEAGWRFLRRLTPDMAFLGVRELLTAYRERRLMEQGFSFPKWVREMMRVLEAVEKAR